MDKLSKLLLCAVCLSVLVNAAAIVAMWLPDPEAASASRAQQAEAEKQEATIAVNQDMQVINGSGKEMWIRVKVDIPELNGKKVFEVVSDTISQQEVSKDEERWIYGKDGYYYYSRTVCPGEQSVPVFYDVKELPKDVCYIPDGDNIKVKAQAIQVNWVPGDVSTGQEAFETFHAVPLEEQVAQLI